MQKNILASRPQRGFWRPHFSPLLKRGVFVAAMGVIMVALVAKFEDLSYQNYVRDLKLDATIDLIEVRGQIEADVIERILDLNQLATVIGQSPQMNNTEFNLKALDFILENPEVRSVAAAPRGVVTKVFPARGSEGVLGRDYNLEALNSPTLSRAMERGETHIGGPITRADGTRALIMRQPVFTTTATGQKTDWGILAVTLDYDLLLTRMGIPEAEERYDLLLREVSPSARGFGQVLFGNTRILRDDPIILDVGFPFGNWQFAATPNGGWPQYLPNYISRLAQYAALVITALVGIWYVISLFDRRRRAEQLLSTGIEALDHGFVMFDAERRLVAFNRKYKQLAGGSGNVKVGTRYEDIVKANLRNGLIPDAVGREVEWYEEWSKRLDIKAADKEQILADGRMIRAYDRPMEDGSVVGLRIDITDLKKAQIAAEAANKAKTDFMGVLSHELRTPLTVILGHAQLAKNIQNMPVYKNLVASIEKHPDAKDELLPQAEALAGQISKMMLSLERSGNHLFTLISEILDFAKIDSGTLSMDMQQVAAVEIVDPIVDQMRPMVEDKGLDLRVNHCAALVKADTQRIQQIMINLVGNATKFTDEGSITVDVSQTDEHVVFSVTDTGIGIPQEHVKRVFEAFHQVDSSSGRKYGGTGLGLAISSDIAKAHGGDLSATSTPGKGSTFTLRLPRVDAKALPATVEEPESVETEETLVA